MWTNGHNEKDIHKEMLPAYAGKCVSPKAVHNWVEKFSQRLSKVTEYSASPTSRFTPGEKAPVPIV
jgi:hypothetical protein